MKKMISFLFLTCLTLSSMLKAQTVSDFENINLGANSYWNGSDYSKGFSSGNAKFNNSYDSAFGGSWSGWAVSNMKDTTSVGYTNQYSVSNGKGYNASSNYAVAYYSAYTRNPTIVLTGAAAGKTVSGCWINNSTYAYLDMVNGTPGVSKKFGGATGNDPDFLKLSVSAFKGGMEVLKKVDLMLADFTSADNSKDYILKNWTWLDLSVLGNIDSLQFSMTSSDTGAFGINTPTYFCMDNFNTTNTALSIGGELNNKNLYLYPNPTTQMIYFSVYGDDAMVNIYDLTGHMVKSNEKLTSNVIDVSEFLSGVYIVQVLKNGVSYQTKFVKQ
ncbi:MAG: DUF4465 domain-containing protein [Bacteroidetes bacterium]|nr:DUF4465 domain-containing protein [Bacteroidota bacterium]